MDRTPELADCQNVTVELTDYKINEHLGEGAYSVVKKATHEATGQPVAIKIINMKDITTKGIPVNQVYNEIAIMKKLKNNAHIIQLQEVLPTKHHLCIVMDYASKGNLFKHIVAKQRLNEDEARSLFRQLIAGVDCCHEKMIIHRDLKPENLLLDENYNLKISDFGLSSIMNGDYLLKGSRGSRNYAAPEVLAQNHEPFYGPPIDVWSCGVILHVMLTGRYPFPGDNFLAVCENIKSNTYQPPAHVSSGAQQLIAGMLTVEPLMRLTIPEIMQHPWFKA